MNIAKSKNWKNCENSIQFSEFEKPKILVLGNGIWKHTQNFRKLAQLEIPKIEGELRARCQAFDKDDSYLYDKNMISKSKI